MRQQPEGRHRRRSEDVYNLPDHPLAGRPSQHSEPVLSASETARHASRQARHGMSHAGSSQARPDTPLPGAPHGRGPARSSLLAALSLFAPLGLQFFLVLKRPDLESRRHRLTDGYGQSGFGQMDVQARSAINTELQRLVSMTTDSVCFRRKKTRPTRESRSCSKSKTGTRGVGS